MLPKELEALLNRFLSHLPPDYAREVRELVVLLAQILKLSLVTLAASAVTYAVSLALHTYLGLPRLSDLLVLDPARELGVTVIAASPMAPLYIVITIIAAIWLAISSAPVGYLVYRWLEPALYPNEQGIAKALIVGFSTAASLCPLATTFLVYPRILYMARLFAESVGVEPVYTVSDLCSLYIACLILTYLLEVYPVALHVWLSTEVGYELFRAFLGSWDSRKWIYIGFYAAVAALTPGDTVVTAILATAYITATTEVILLHHMRKRRRRHGKEEEV